MSFHTVPPGLANYHFDNRSHSFPRWTHLNSLILQYSSVLVFHHPILYCAVLQTFLNHWLYGKLGYYAIRFKILYLPIPRSRIFFSHILGFYPSWFILYSIGEKVPASDPSVPPVPFSQLWWRNSISLRATTITHVFSAYHNPAALLKPNNPFSAPCMALHLIMNVCVTSFYMSTPQHNGAIQSIWKG